MYSVDNSKSKMISMLHSCLPPLRALMPGCLDAWGGHWPATSFLMRASVVLSVCNVLFLTSLSSERHVRGSHDALHVHLADPQSLAVGFIMNWLNAYYLHLSIQRIRSGLFFFDNLLHASIPLIGRPHADLVPLLQLTSVSS